MNARRIRAARRLCLLISMIGVALVLPAAARGDSQENGTSSMPGMDMPGMQMPGTQVPGIPSRPGMPDSSMQGGNAPPDARSGDYSDGYRYGAIQGMDMADNRSLAMVMLDQLEYAHS